MCRIMRVCSQGLCDSKIMVLIFEQGTLETKREFQSRINESIKHYNNKLTLQMTEDVNGLLTIAVFIA